jgi:mannose-1-phosphate guanylyltransferase
MPRELGRLEPEFRKAAKSAVDNLTSDLDFYRLAEAPFSQAPKKSIDYAVMENAPISRRCRRSRSAGPRRQLERGVGCSAVG